LLLAGVAALALLGVTSVHAQDATAPLPDGTLEIVSVEHSADGTITVTVTPPPKDSDAERFNALVDGVSATVRDVVVPTRDNASIVIAIDTSGSMAGAPTVSARSAAFRLVENLDPNDAVAIVAFAAQPIVLSSFTTDRAITQSALSAVQAEGDTALYAAVELSAELLQERPGDGPRVLVLLSDGQNSGAGATEDDRQASIDRVAAGDAVVHAFGLGAEADEAYLDDLADASAGSYSVVESEQFLGALFELLGQQLSSTWQVVIGVPPLASGEHRLELLAFVDGALVTRQQGFAVDNAGLVTPILASGDEPEFVVIDIATAVPSELLRIEASVGDVPATYTGGQVFVDAWSVDAGAQQLRIDVFVGDALAATTLVSIDVPALEPELAVSANLEAVPPILAVSGRAQGAGGHLLRVLADGEEIATTNARELRSEYPVGSEVSVELLASEGASEPLAREVLTPEGASAVSSGGGPGFDITYPLLAAAVLGLGALALLLLRSRRARKRPSYRAARRFRAPRELPGRPQQNGPFGTVRVYAPDGSEQIVTLGLRPLTLGSSRDCDIVLEGDDIQPVHARLSARGNGEFQVHGLATKSSRPFSEGAVEEWAVLHAGESIVLGGYELSIGEAVAEQRESA
jgi:uncharacterized protein YegL